MRQSALLPQMPWLYTCRWDAPNISHSPYLNPDKLTAAGVASHAGSLVRLLELTGLISQQCRQDGAAMYFSKCLSCGGRPLREHAVSVRCVCFFLQRAAPLAPAQLGASRLELIPLLQARHGVSSRCGLNLRLLLLYAATALTVHLMCIICDTDALSVNLEAADIPECSSSHLCEPALVHAYLIFHACVLKA